MPSSIQFLYSGVSSVVVVTALPSVVSPARNRGGGKSSRANQHKEFARTRYHKIDVNI